MAELAQAAVGAVLGVTGDRAEPGRVVKEGQRATALVARDRGTLLTADAQAHGCSCR